MNHLFLLLIAFTCSNSFGQNIFSSKKDISDAKEIIFYGYDFSHFKLAEAKRLNNDNISIYVPAWIGFLNVTKNEKYYASKLKTKKVIFDFDYTTEIAKNLKNESLVSITKNLISPDSIQNIINNYHVKQKEGIGFVIIIECFEKITKESSAYFTFFDIFTKNIIMSHRYSSSSTQGQGLTNYWGNGISETIYQYFESIYRKQLKN